MLHLALALSELQNGMALGQRLSLEEDEQRRPRQGGEVVNERLQPGIPPLLQSILDDDHATPPQEGEGIAGTTQLSQRDGRLQRLTVQPQHLLVGLLMYEPGESLILLQGIVPVDEIEHQGWRV